MTPLFANERTAAKLLDMELEQFRNLVKGGHLPGPKRIGPLERWDTEELQQIISGNAIDGLEALKW